MSRLMTQRVVVRAGIGVAVAGVAIAAGTSATAGARVHRSIRAEATPAVASGYRLSDDYAAVSPAAKTFVVGLSGKKTTGLPKVMTPGYHTFVVKQLAKGVRDLNVVRFLDPTYNRKKADRDFGLIFGPKFDPKAYHRLVTRLALEDAMSTQSGPAIASQITLKLKPSSTYYFDNADDNGGPGDIVTKVTTTGPDTATGSAPRFTATIKQQEYGFGIAGTFHGGTQTVRLSNVGAQLHELGMAQILDPTKTEQDAVDALVNGDPNSPPPSWLSFAAFGGLHTPKDTEYVKLRLQSGGRYVLFCFMPAASNGAPHIMLGMHRLITVL
ncbi:MAG TPA: hypothetical protein VHE83_14565 [Mycobacteriales bacterium]|nr:hypothetical protein [Mycobacteriales bacterium]